MKGLFSSIQENMNVHIATSTFHSNICEAKAGGYTFQSQLRLHSEVEANLLYMFTAPRSKKKEKKKQ